MRDEAIRLASLGKIVRRRWRLLTALAVLGALAGAGASLLFSPGYRTSAGVLLQGPRQADELLTEAQVAQSTTVLDRAAAALGWQVSGSELRKSVTATVTDGNIVRITGTADTPERAQQLTDQVAQQYVAFSGQLITNTSDAAAQQFQQQKEALRQQVAQTDQRITELVRQAPGSTVEGVQARTELEALRTALADAMTKLDEADAASSQAKMAVLGPAERPAGPAAPTMVQLVGAGALVFFLAGLVGHLFAARSDRRVRSAAETAAALGAPLLAEVDVPDEPPAAPAGLRARLWRLVWDGRPWDMPPFPAARGSEGVDLRYRRVLGRLREGRRTGVRVLLLVADDDPAAHRAVSRLVVAAGSERTDVPVLLGLADFAARRPTVPQDDQVAGAVVVLTAGTRTGWELVGIAEACADAGHRVVGTVVAHRTRPIEPTRPERPIAAARSLAGSS
ncbi:MAG TPA: exopolysaccharide biosynthesis protein [Amycolatopsis sp.]|nr:exopolysaccharide biosynthesis protein [Amycolatopsis sp.]